MFITRLIACSYILPQLIYCGTLVISVIIDNKKTKTHKNKESSGDDISPPPNPKYEFCPAFPLYYPAKDYFTDQTTTSNNVTGENYAQTMCISRQGITSGGEIAVKDGFSPGPE